MFSVKAHEDHPRQESHGGYVETIRGLVNVSEFETHVTYLHGIDSEVFENYKHGLLAITLVNHKQTREKFFEYVEALRNGEVDKDDFEVHVSRLREYTDINIDKEEQYRYSVLFDETKKRFWNITPSYYETRAISENESVKNLYRILSGIDYGEATLGEVLRALGLLEVVGDYNVELVCAIKQMLCQYHPDRNKHEAASEIFTLIDEYVHKPVSIIFEDFEKYTDCSYTSCQLDEFLTWRVAKIKEVREEEEKNLHHSLEYRGKKALAIYNHLLSKVEPAGDFGYSILDERFKWQRPPNTFRMKCYRREKAYILKEKDEILVVFRTIIEEYSSLCERQISRRQQIKELVDIEGKERRGNDAILIEKIEDLSRQIESDKEGIKEREKFLEEKMKKMKSLLEDFIPLYDPMIERYEREINYFKDVCAGKIDFGKKWDVRCEWNQAEVDWRERKIKEAKLNTFVDERRIILYHDRLSKIKGEKERMETLLNYLSEDRAKPTVLNRFGKQLWNIGKFVVNYFPLDSIFSVSNVISMIYLGSAYTNVRLMVEQFKTERILSQQNEDRENLKAKYENFRYRFKTEEEKLEVSQKYHKNVEKKELLALIKEKREVEAEIKDARRGKELAKNEAELLGNLLLKLQSGDLTLN